MSLPFMYVHKNKSPHGDFDHMGDSIYLINNYNIKNVVLNNDSFNELETNLINELKNKKIKYYQNVKKIPISNNIITILNTKEYDNENDNSNVIYIELNNYKFMFMGDAGVDKEKDVLNNLDKSKIYRTDEGGSIMFKIKNNEY